MEKMIPSVIWMAALCAVALVSNSGFAQSTRFYIKGGVGPAFTEKTSLREFASMPVSDTKVKFEPGVQLRFTGGFHITDWLATELETGVTYNNIKSITGADEARGSLLNAPLLANLVVQCPKKARFAPYIGGGLGFSSAILDADSIVIQGIGISGTQSDTVFAYHGFAGVRYNIDEHMAVSLDYRYFGTTAPSWDADFGGSARTRFGDNQTHSVTAAFTYSF